MQGLGDRGWPVGRGPLGGGRLRDRPAAKRHPPPVFCGAKGLTGPERVDLASNRWPVWRRRGLVVKGHTQPRWWWDQRRGRGGRWRKRHQPRHPL